MCKFFSFVTDNKGNKYYFNWEQRKEHMAEDKDSRELDSHSYIAEFYNFKDTDSPFNKKQEKYLNKYEYNPLTKEFTKDYIGKFDDSKEAEEWVKSVDFKTIIKPLIIKPIFNPLTDRNPILVSKKDKELLEQWASIWDSVGSSVGSSVGNSVRASIRDSVGNSVWNSVGDSVRNNVWNSVGNSVWASVRASVKGSVRASVRASVGSSVWDSVGNSVWASVWYSVWNSVKDSVRDGMWSSVWDSVWAYASGFFDIEFDYDFSPVVKLWERGYVPSFDGKTWRLHKGPDAEIVYAWEKGE